jgi:hypothetical protein
VKITFSEYQNAKENNNVKSFLQSVVINDKNILPSITWYDVFKTDKINFLNNIPNSKNTFEIVVNNAHSIANNKGLFEKLSERFSAEIVSRSITSWYRGSTLNVEVGGSENSAHLSGLAIDIDIDNRNSELFNDLRNLENFDQLIWEYGDSNNPKWIHIGYNFFDSKNRKQVFSIPAQTISTNFKPTDSTTGLHNLGNVTPIDKKEFFNYIYKERRNYNYFKRNIDKDFTDFFRFLFTYYDLRIDFGYSYDFINSTKDDKIRYGLTEYKSEKSFEITSRKSKSFMTELLNKEKNTINFNTQFNQDFFYKKYLEFLEKGFSDPILFSFYLDVGEGSNFPKFGDLESKGVVTDGGYLNYLLNTQPITTDSTILTRYRNYLSKYFRLSDLIS